MKRIIKRLIGETNISIFKDVYKCFSPMYKREIKVRKDFYQTFLDKNDLCFDIGANIGNRITPMLQLGALVVAVEPQETCYKFLEYKFGNKIILVKKGLCEKECIRKFHIANANTISSFSEEWINAVKNGRFKEYDWNKIIDVEMTTLDNLIEKHGLPSFIKIDVEGYELEVLKGLSKPIKMISFEYTVPEQTDKAIACIKIIENNNSNILCNYSIGESMKWALTKWLPAPDFIDFIINGNIIKTGFGDIYIKLKLNAE
jgi:FkbM family methyltransferase